MGDIRVWLDGHHIETSGFSYREGADCGMARLAFSVKREAEAFAEQFAGRVVPDMPTRLAAVNAGRVFAD
jgi:hypothetical protein